METKTNDKQIEEYKKFLRSLDDFEIIDHAKSFSTDGGKKRDRGQMEARTQDDALDSGIITSNFMHQKILSSNSTDPFDDDLDEILCNGEFQRDTLKSRTSTPKLLEDIDFEESFSLSEIQHLKEMETEQNHSDVAADATISDNDASEGEVVLPRHLFGDFGTYFHNKHVKQLKSDREYVKWDLERRRLMEGESATIRTPIFKGLVFHVNGYTESPINEIHQQVILYGGIFLSYLGKKSAVTHIICDRLTPRKEVEFKHCKVVKSKWIADCISRNVLLDWKPYRLVDINTPGQKDIFNFINHPSHAEEQVASSKQEDEPIAMDGENNLGSDVGKAECEDSDQEDANDAFLMTQADDAIEAEIELQKSAIERLEAYDSNLHNTNKAPVDARDPKFLDHFFAKSRLHHLSAWKAELRQRFLNKILSGDSKIDRNVTLNKPTSAIKKTIFHVDFDCFFVSVSTLKYPGLDINKVPIAVTHGGRTSDIASCNYVAREYGVRNGMWGARAKTLCSDLVFLPYDFASYEELSTKFYDYLIGLGIFDHIYPVLVDEVLLDVSTYCGNSSQVNDTVNEISLKIRDDVRSLTGCNVSVGASCNVLLAKLALKKAKPNGQFFLCEDINNFLDDIKISDLPGVGHHIKDRLMNEIPQLGLEVPLIKHLKLLSEHKLISLFGQKTGTKLFQQARGFDDTSVELNIRNSEQILGRKSVSVDVNYGIRFDEISQVDTFLMNLSKELHKRLEKLGLSGSSLTLRLARRALGQPREPPKYLGMGICDLVSKSSRLGVPTNNWGIIGSEAKALFRMLNVPVGELRGVALTLTKLCNSYDTKKDKQKQLPFKSMENAPLNLSEDKKVEVEVKSLKNLYEFSAKDIDISVFNELPEELKKELKIDLQRRGLLDRPLLQLLEDTKKFRSPKKPRIYWQQLISPSKSDQQYVRVIESPTKSSKNRGRILNMNSPINSPTKKSNTNGENTTGASSILPSKSTNKFQPIPSSSYDSSVLCELPSSIRENVLQERDYMRKLKSIQYGAPKEKPKAIKTELANTQLEIGQDFLEDQKSYSAYPIFFHEKLLFREIKCLLEEWVSTSLEQAGPHDDDIKVLIRYLEECLLMGRVSRCLNILKCLQENIRFQESIVKFNLKNRNGSNDFELLLAGIHDWNDKIESLILPKIEGYCKIHCVYIDK